MNKSFKITVQDNSETMFIGVSGVVKEDDVFQFENSLHAVEKTKDHRIFVFDFTFLEEIPTVAITIIVLMQMEARKKGQVYTLPPKNHLKTVLLEAGAIRDSELLNTYLNSSITLEEDHPALKRII